MTDSPKHDQTENFFDNKKLKLASYLYENTKFASNYNFLSQAETLKQLILYAKRKPNLYYDILMFPDSRKDGFDELYLSEISCFPDFKWY